MLTPPIKECTLGGGAHLSHLVLLTGDGEERLDASVQFPPLPVPQGQPAANVPLDDGESDSLVAQLLVVLTHQVATDVGLQHNAKLHSSLKIEAVS